MAAISMTPLISLLSANALAPLVIITALGILIFGPRRRLLSAGPAWLAVVLGLLVLLGVISSAWSLVPSQSIRKALQLLPMFAASYVLVATGFQMSVDARRRIGRGVAGGVAAAIILLAFEVASGGLLNHFLFAGPLHSPDSFIRYKRGVVVLGLLAGPATYWTWHHFGRLSAIAILAAAALCAVLVHSGAAMVAIVIAVLAVIGVTMFASFGCRVLAVLVATAILVSPVAVLGPKEPPDLARSLSAAGMDRLNSAMHRLLIWQFVGGRIVERPLLGWGLESSRAVPGGHERPANFPELLPLHPHNAALQLWLELGVLGAALGAFIAAWPLLRIGRTMSAGPSQAAAAGVALATVVIALVSFGIWQSWWIGAIALVAMTAVTIFPPQADVG